MTQTNNEREIINKLALECGLILKTTNLDLCPSYLTKLEAFAKAYAISQNEQQDVVAWVVKIPESRRGCSNDIVFYYKMSEMLKEHILAGDDVTPLYASPPKQRPDGWKPIETVPKDGTQVIIKCSGGRVATAFYDDKPFVGEGWHVVVPFLGGVGSGTDTFIYFQEDMPTHWMPLPSAPTTSLTSETNTEVGE